MKASGLATTPRRASMVAICRVESPSSTRTTASPSPGPSKSSVKKYEPRK
ncbi:hypothetical protein [Pseudonocardia sp. T1-2H]